MSVPPPNFLEWDDNEIPAGYRVIIIRLINYFKDVRKGDPVPEGIEVVFGNESQVPLFYRVKPNLIQIIHNMAGYFSERESLYLYESIYLPYYGLFVSNLV